MRRIDKRRISHLVLASLSFVSLTVFATAWADDGDEAAEHEAFMKASTSLATAVTVAENQTGARAIAAEFEHDDGVYIYEVELLTADGKALEAEVDAQTATVLEVESENEEGAEGRDDRDDD